MPIIWIKPERLDNTMLVQRAHLAITARDNYEPLSPGYHSKELCPTELTQFLTPGHLLACHCTFFTCSLQTFSLRGMGKQSIFQANRARSQPVLTDSRTGIEMRVVQYNFVL